MAVPASPCEACDARCCLSYVVPLTGEDAWRLAVRSGVAIERLVACAPQPEPTPASFLLSPEGPHHELVLAAQACHPRAPCPFLRAGGAGGRCAAYAFRPRACRRFPAVRAGGAVAARDGIPCPAGAWPPSRMAGVSWRAALAREERDAALYAEVVAEWNARLVARGGGASARGYLDHLEETYRWLVPWRASLPPRERSGAPFLARVRAALGALGPTRPRAGAPRPAPSAG